jgi:hypothetical protein
VTEASTRNIANSGKERIRTFRFLSEESWLDMECPECARTLIFENSFIRAVQNSGMWHEEET